MKAPIRVLELRSVRGTGGGPEKTILLGAARSNAGRVHVTVCYIRDARDEEFDIDRRAAELGVDYVEIPERHSFDLSIWPALRRLVRERRIDIVHAHEHKTDLLALLLARAEGILPVATAHGWSGRSLRERFYYLFDKRLLARYPLVIAVSEPTRQTVIAHGGDPSRVRRIPNAIDHPTFTRNQPARLKARATLGLPADAVIVGSIGRLEPVKRFDLLLDAVAMVSLDRAVHVAIAGEGACRAELEVQASRLGLGHRVHLLGHRRDIQELHQVFDVYVQTSDSEGFPNAILEAMALETPVVATSVGGTGELIDDGIHGLLVGPRDPSAVADAIARTMGHPRRTAARVRCARRRVNRELSFDARMAEVERLYVDLMATRSYPYGQGDLRWT